MHNHPGVNIIPIHGKTPKIHESAFIAPGCTIIGDVEIGAESSVWYNCVIRADVNFIRIGERTNIQDGTVIHCDSATPVTPNGHATVIGDDVLVGHMVMLHGATLEDRAFVGLSTTVMDGCVIEGDGMLAAGAMLTPNKRIPSGQLWAGAPAKYLRDLTEAAIAGMRMGTAHYVENAKLHAEAVRSSST
jgi:carbonic anhydrase/acetyltransferase-like protein (isoleucine patch superfamily)